MLSEEEIDKIAKRVLELNVVEERYKYRVYPSTLIKNKYHQEIYKRFGATGTIEDAIRTVATYKCGARVLRQIPVEKHVEFAEYMEKLYKDILGEEEIER